MRNAEKVQAFEQADRIWKIAEMALEDFQQVTTSPRYIVDMGNWHSPLHDKCRICFAGSVLAGRYARDPGAYVHLSDLIGPTALRMSVLDHFRLGGLTGWLTDSVYYFYGDASPQYTTLIAVLHAGPLADALNWKPKADPAVSGSIVPADQLPAFVKTMKARIAFCKEHDL